jgi:hypothetical protein
MKSHFLLSNKYGLSSPNAFIADPVLDSRSRLTVRQAPVDKAADRGSTNRRGNDKV